MTKAQYMAVMKFLGVKQRLLNCIIPWPVLPSLYRYSGVRKFLLAFLLVISCNYLALAAARTASVSGNWSNTATWGGSAVPVAGDAVTINSGITVTVNANASCTSLDFLSTATVASNVNISSGITLTVSGTVTIPRPNAVTNTLAVGAGSLNTANIAFTNGGNANRHQITISTGTVTVSGNITQTGSTGSASIIFTGAGLLQVGGTFLTAATGTLTTVAGSTVEYNAAGAQTVGDFTYAGNLTLSGSGAKTLGTVTTIGGNLTLSGNATATTGANLAVTGNLSVGDGTTFTAAGFTLTVTGTTTVGGGTSGILAISSATGTKTFTGAVTVNSGGAITESAAATIAFGNDVTIGGTLTENGAATVGFAGNLTNNGTYTASSGVHTFSGALKTIGGTSTNTIPSVTISGTTTNNGTLTISTTLAGGSILTNAATGVLNFGGGSITPPLTATAVGNTVNYTGTGQTLKVTAYHHLILSGGAETFGAIITIAGNLTLSNTATATTAAALTIGGNLNIGNGTTFTIPAFSLNVNGTTTVGGGTSGTLAISSATGAKTFTGAVTINPGGIMSEGAAASAALNFGSDVTISGTLTENGAALVGFAGNLTNNGTYNASTGMHTFTGVTKIIGGTSVNTIPSAGFSGTYTNSGTLTCANSLSGAGGTLIQGAATILNLGGTSTITTLTATAAGNTVNYNGGAAQNVFATPYYNLSFSNAGAKTLPAGTTTVAGNWDVTAASAALNTNNSSVTVTGNITGNGVITSGTGTITVTGNWTNSAVFACGTGTVNYNGVNQITSGQTYYNLIISGGGTKTLSWTTAVNSILTLTSGILQLGNNNLTIANTTGISAITGTFSAANMIETNGTGSLIVSSNTNNNSFNGTYPVGNGAYYDPVILLGLAPIAPAARSILIRSVPTNPAIFNNGLNKYWDITANSIAVGAATISLQYNNAEASGSTAAYLPYNNTSGSWLVATGPSALGANPVSSLGSAFLTGKWTAGSQDTYYSYQNGNWNVPTTWTTDPSGTIQVGTTFPGNSDFVEILPGRTVTLPSNIASTNLTITIDAFGFLDLSTYQFTSGIKTLSGQGTLVISSMPAVFPVIATNNFVNVGGGTTEYRSNTVLPSQSNYNNLSINAGGSIVTQTVNLTLNGNLSVKAGTFQINDLTTRRLQLTVNGNTSVEAGAVFKVGTGVTNNLTSNPIGITGGTPPFINYYDAQSHRIVFKGDFTNNGTVSFTNLTYPVYNAFPSTTWGPTSGFATVYFQGTSNNTLLCAGPTDFYNLVLDKGTDQSFKLSVYTSGPYSNFRLLGANTAGVDVVNATATNPNLKKALWIRTGTLEIQGTTVIPSLSEGANGDGSTLFTVPVNGALVMNGVDAAVFTTADDYREINTAYGTSLAGNTIGISQGAGNGFCILGKLEIDKGYFSTKESEGIITTNVASGQFIINNGTVDAKQFLSSTGSASFEQYGGMVQLRGRFQRTPSAYSSVDNLVSAPLNTFRANDACLTAGSGTFSLNNATNVFTMGGGNMQIFDVCGAAATMAFQVNSSISNINVTGGTVQFIPNTRSGGTADVLTHIITTTAPFGNVILNRTSSASVVQLSTPITVLGNLTLSSGVLNANNLNVSVGGDLYIETGTSYTVGTNTTILNGSGPQTFTVNLGAPLTLNNLTFNKFSGISVNMAGSQKSINVGGNFNLTLGTLNDNGDSFFIKQNVYNSGVHNGTGKISLNGVIAQTIDGNGIFQNLELNNTNGLAGTSPVSLVANTTVNGMLTFSQDRLFNIGTYNLLLNANASIANASASRYIQTAGNSGDGGVTKFYSSTSAFTFPVGAPSTSHAGVPKWTPATIGFTSAPTVYGSVAVIPVGYEHPATTQNGQSLSYFWSVKSSGFVGIPANSISHTFIYDQTDVTGTEAIYIPSVYNRTLYNWNNGLAANINIGSNTISVWSLPTNSSSFLDGDFTAGDNTTGLGAFGSPKKFYSIASSAWNLNTTWSYSSGGPAVPAGAVAGVNFPGANSIVIIENNNTVNLTATANCASLQIQAGSILDIYTWTGSVFSSVLSYPTGLNGLFRLTTTVTGGNVPKVFSFPANSDFSDFNNNHGTTEFYDIDGTTGALYILPANVTSYGNLMVTARGGDNLVLPNNGLTTIQGDLTCGGDNANAWIAVSWNTTETPYNSALYNPTVEKTIHITGNLNVNTGTLIFMPEIVPQHLIIDGNVTVGANGYIDVQPAIYGVPTGAPLANTMSIGGSLTNNSTGAPYVRLQNAGYYCDLTFQGSTPAVFSGTSASTIINNLIINKGNSQATSLNCNIAGTLTTPVDNWLTLQNGTFQYTRTNPNTDFTISTTTPFTIPSTAGLYVNYSNVNNHNVLIANNATNTNDLFLGGKLTVANGNVYVGPIAAPANNNDIEYASAGTPTIQVDGGILVVNGQIRRNPSITTGALSYNQTAGTVTINGNAANATNAKFEILNTGSTFNMSGGTLNLIRGGGGALYGDLYIRPNSSIVTGGSIVFSNVIPNTVQNYLLDATVPLNNLTITGAAIAGTNATVTLMVNPLTLNGNLLLSNAQSIFDANTTNSINLTIKGNFTNNGTYNFYNNLTTFSGGVQLLTGTTITNFYNLIVNPVTSLTLNSNNCTVNNNLSLRNGTLFCGIYNVNVKANLDNNASYSDNGGTSGIILNGTLLQLISGTGTFGQLNLNNSSGAALNNDITMTENLILTSGILDISQYLLTLGINSIITANGTGFSASKMVTSDGVWSNVGIKKIFNTSPPASFTYPLGIPGKYTPTVVLITANGSTGSIRINNINHHHPAVVDPNNVLNYYYEVESSGITGFSGSFLFNYLVGDVIGGPECGYGYYSAKLITPGILWSKSASGVNCVTHSLSFNYTTVDDASITGEYTAGLDAAIPNTVPQYTSIADGNWTDQSIWVPSGGSTYPCPAGGPNGFVVTINNVVTANANNCTAYKTYINNKLRIVNPLFGHYLGTVYGNGTLYLESPMFPAGRFGAFLDCSGTSTIEYGGSGNYLITADLYSSVPNLTFSGTGIRVLPNKDLTICHQLLINGPLLDNSTYNRELFIQGTMLLSSGAFASGTGDNATVSFSGTSAQSIQGFSGTNAINNLEINNNAGLTLTGSVDVANKLFLTNGLITTTAVNLLKITNFSTSCVYPNGGSSTSYVDGPLSKNLNRGDPVFKFPIGKKSSGFGNKLWLRATETSTMYWTAEYFNPNTYPTYAAPLAAINTKEYWTVNCSISGSQAFINVAWDPLSNLTPLVTQNGVSDLRVVEHNGTDWVQIASTPNAGSDNYNGSVETTSVTTLVTGTRNYSLGAINAVRPKVSMSPTGPICGVGGIPVSLTSSLSIVAPFTINYTENGTPKSITPASFPATIPTSAGGATYVLTSFTYNYPSGTLLTGVVDLNPVTTNAVPTTANAGPDQSLCGATSATLAGNAPIVGTGVWSIISGAGGTVVTPTLQNSVFNGTNGSTYTLRWTISSGSCLSFDDVVISFPLLAAQPAAFTASTPTLCQGTSGVVYTVPNDLSVTYNWNYSGTGATIFGTTNSVTISYNTSAISGTLSVTATNGCNTSAPQSLAITVNPLPTVNVGGALAAICQTGTTVALGGSYGGGATSALWTDGGAGGTFTNNVGSTPGTTTYTASATFITPVTLTLTTGGGSCATTSANKLLIVNPSVVTPVFALGATTTRCQGAGSLTYTATATNNTGLIYTLDAASITGGNTIVAGTGAVNWAAGWSGTSIVTVSASGCNGPLTAIHTITITPTVGTPVFALGTTSIRCQGAGLVTYTATSTNNTGLTYSLDASSITGGNSIIAGTGDVTYVAGWSGASIITVSATGCSGPKTATHTVTITPMPAATISYGAQNCSMPVTLTGTAGGSFSSAPAGLTINAFSGLINSATSFPNTYTVTYSVPAAGGCGLFTTTTPVTIVSDRTWTGSVGTDWNTAGNWSCNIIPDLTTNVLIPNVANKPILNGGATGSAKNIQINSSSSLTVVGNTLQIAGTITNNGTFTADNGTIEMKGTAAQVIPSGSFAGNNLMNLVISNTLGVTLGGALNITGYLKAATGDLASNGNLKLISSAVQTALIDGSGNAQVTGNVTMQRYLAVGYGYKYFSSPFTSLTVNAFLPFVNLGATFPTFYKYNENNSIGGLGVDFISGWVNWVNIANSLNPMAGYAVNFGNLLAPKTVEVTGVVSNGTVTSTLFNNNRIYTTGFNLVGNPYPSPIDWYAASGWTKTNIDNAIYFFDSSGAIDEYSGVYCSFVNGVSIGGSTNIIPSLQGFFVHVTDGSYPVTGTLGMTNSVRKNDFTQPFKVASFDPRTILRFTAGFDAKGSISDQFVIYFDPLSTPLFDKEKDALKLMNTDATVPNLYLLTSDARKVSISGIPAPNDSITQIPIGIKTLKDGWIIFDALDISLLPDALNIYLVDSEKKTIQDLKTVSSYRFYITAGENLKRFYLIFSTKDLTQSPPPKGRFFKLSKSSNKIMINVNLPFNTDGDLIVTNMQGQIMLRKSVYGIETVELNTNISSGVYIISVVSGKDRDSEKIIIRKDYE